MFTSLLCISTAASAFFMDVSARHIVFPRVAGADPYQSTLVSNLDGIDIVSGSQFSGLTTFANVPYAACFADGPASEKYDIALLGAPFDTVSQLVSTVLYHLSPVACFLSLAVVI